MNLCKTMLSVALSSVLIAGQSHADTSVGAYVDYDGWSTAKIDAFNIDTARPAATINIFSTFDNNWSGQLRHQTSNIVSRGATPLITWMPYKSDRPDANILEEIIDGKHDVYVASWLEGFKYWLSTYPTHQQPKIALRFAHEFNATWYPWGNNPNAMKAAWRHLHRLFAQKGVSHAVDWVWCANNVSVDSYNDITQYYPGDDVVDWLSIDGYNWGSNYSYTSWKSFDETFSQQYVKMVENYPGKPIMLAEVGSAEPHNTPDPAKGQDGDDTDAFESKELWISDMMESIKEDYPAIKSIVWFNTNKELDWALNLEGNTGLSAYNNAVSDDYFSGTLELSIPSDDDDDDDDDDDNDDNDDNDDARPELAERAAVGSTPKAKKVNRVNKKLTAYAMALAKKPQITGSVKLSKEAQGLRKTNKGMLRKWRLESILPKVIDTNP